MYYKTKPVGMFIKNYYCHDLRRQIKVGKLIVCSVYEYFIHRKCNKIDVESMAAYDIKCHSSKVQPHLPVQVVMEEQTLVLSAVCYSSKTCGS